MPRGEACYVSIASFAWLAEVVRSSEMIFKRRQAGENPFLKKEPTLPEPDSGGAERENDAEGGHETSSQAASANPFDHQSNTAEPNTASEKPTSPLDAAHSARPERASKPRPAAPQASPPARDNSTMVKKGGPQPLAIDPSIQPKRAQFSDVVIDDPNAFDANRPPRVSCSQAGRRTTSRPRCATSVQGARSASAKSGADHRANFDTSVS